MTVTATTAKPKAKKSRKAKASKKPHIGRVYIGRDENGKQLFEYVGRFAKKKERNAAVAKARAARGNASGSEIPLCDEYVDRYLADYGRRNRESSHDIASERLARFRKDFAGRRLDIPRAELKDWMNGEVSWSHREPVPKGYRPAIVTLYNHAIDEDDIPLERNPARKLGQRTKSKRSQTPPPTEAEFQLLLDSCSVLGDYAPRMRELMLFAAYELMRPSELYALEESKIDFRRMRVLKDARVYKGKVDAPKTGVVLVPLTPPARDAIANRPRNDQGLVFLSKEDKRLSQATLSGYWAQVKAAAGLDFDFYHATKHYGVHYMWSEPELEMSPRAIAALAGWKVSTVIEMLETYGHGDVGALEEVDAAFARAGRNVRHLRTIEGMQS
jgi:integrase